MRPQPLGQSVTLRCHNNCLAGFCLRIDMFNNARGSCEERRTVVMTTVTPRWPAAAERCTAAAPSVKVQSHYKIDLSFASSINRSVSSGAPVAPCSVVWWCRNTLRDGNMSATRVDVVLEASACHQQLDEPEHDVGAVPDQSTSVCCPSNSPTTAVVVSVATVVVFW